MHRRRHVFCTESSPRNGNRDDSIVNFHALPLTLVCSPPSFFFRPTLKEYLINTMASIQRLKYFAKHIYIMSVLLTNCAGEPSPRKVQNAMIQDTQLVWPDAIVPYKIGADIRPCMSFLQLYTTNTTTCARNVPLRMYYVVELLI